MDRVDETGAASRPPARRLTRASTVAQLPCRITADKPAAKWQHRGPVSARSPRTAQ